MQSLFIFILGGSAAILTFAALFAVLSVFYLKPIEGIAEQIRRQAGRNFWLGLVNTVFLAGILFLFISLGEGSGIRLFFLPAILSVLLFAIGSVFGLSSLSLITTQRLFPTFANFSGQWRGSIVLLLAFAAPYIGWFVLFPFLLLMGFGGFLSFLFQQLRSNKRENKSDK